MERIHKIGIGVSLLILAIVALCRFLPEREPNYTVEATVELIRVDPTALGGPEEEKEAEKDMTEHSTSGEREEVEPVD